MKSVVRTSLTGVSPANRPGSSEEELTLVTRLFDLVASSLVLAILSPILVVIGVLIKLDSPGPVFYRGLRTGLHGRPFLMWKFRTMVQNADQLGGPSTGLQDPRVTNIGRLLRRLKIDELPQLINVITGEMSVVGPRPEVPQYTALYDEEEQLILSVRPGITDYASIRFAKLDEVLGSEAPDHVYETRVRPIKNALRLKYVRERCFATDMKILARTFLRLVFREPHQGEGTSWNT